MSPHDSTFEERRPQDPPQIPGLGLKKLALRKDVAKEIVQAIIHKLDTDLDEALQYEEIERHVKAARLQIPDETLRKMFDEADYKGDKKLDVDEIVTAVSGIHQYRKMTEEWLYFVGSFFPQENIFCFPEELPRREVIRDARDRTNDMRLSGTIFKPDMISATLNTPMIYQRPLSREKYVPSKEQEDELARRQAEFAQNRDYWAQRTKAHIVNDHPIDDARAVKGTGSEGWVNQAILPENHQAKGSKRNSISEASVMQVLDQLKADSAFKENLLNATSQQPSTFSFKAKERFETNLVQEKKDSELRVFMKKAAIETKEKIAKEEAAAKDEAERKKRQAQRQYFRALTGSPTKNLIPESPSPNRATRKSSVSEGVVDEAPEEMRSEASGSSFNDEPGQLYSKNSGIPLTQSYDVGDINFGSPKDPRLNRPILPEPEMKATPRKLNTYFHLSTRLDEKQEAAKNRSLPADGSNPIILEPVPGPFPYRHRDDYNPEDDGKNDFARVFAYRKVSQLNDKKPDIVDPSELWPAERGTGDLDSQMKEKNMRRELKTRDFNCFVDRPRFGFNKYHELGKGRVRPDYRPLGVDYYPGSRPSSVTWDKKWENLMGTKKPSRFDTNGRPLKPGAVDYLKFLGYQYDGYLYDKTKDPHAGRRRTRTAS